MNEVAGSKRVTNVLREIRRQRGYVYVAHTKDKAFVKIGHSLNPRRRISDLESEIGRELIIHGVMRGGFELERKLLESLSFFLIKDEFWGGSREWFSGEKRIWNLIATLPLESYVGNDRAATPLKFSPPIGDVVGGEVTPPASLDRMKELRASGFTISAIGREVGLGYSAVRWFLNQAGVSTTVRPKPPKKLRGGVIDLAGRKFTRLTAIEYAGKQMWVVKCDCGAVKKVKGYFLTRGRTKSCGCLSRDWMSELRTRMGKRTYTPEQRRRIMEQSAEESAKEFGLPVRSMRAMRSKMIRDERKAKDAA